MAGRYLHDRSGFLFRARGGCGGGKGIAAMSRVVDIRDGQPVSITGKPVPDVVIAVEEMLGQAKAGSIHAIAAAYDTPQGVVYRVCGSAMGFDLLGGLEMVKARIIRMME
jgi:hypothetical protein